MERMKRDWLKDGGRKVITDRSRHGTEEARLAEGWRERKVLREVDLEWRKRNWLKDGGRERY